MKKIAARIVALTIFFLYIPAIMFDCTVGIPIFILTGNVFIGMDFVQDIETWANNNS